MEQDINKNIRILEESIIQEKYHLYKKDLKKCVSNVIKAYKEQNDIIKTANIAIKDLQEKLKNYIPVSLVEEKIEELKNTKGDYATYIATSERIAVLQELLEKRK